MPPTNNKKQRRSAAWFSRQDIYGFIYRSWVRNRGVPNDQFDGRPVIGICNTWSELTPCNTHFRVIAEHVRNGVLVNCVTPAAAQTAILDQVTPEFAQYMLSKIPMGRFVKVEEIAALVCWLASAECSFSTGAVFDISGGRATY